MTVKGSIDTVSICRDLLASGVGVKYKRLAKAIEEAIRVGSIRAGDKLPPHRILADKIGVTAGTVSNAYAELERTGLVVARVGDGTFVRKRDQERSRDAGFHNFPGAPDRFHDMSHNMHIPGVEADLLALTLTQIAKDPERLQELLLYTPEAGILRHRQAGAKWLAHGNFQPSPEQIVCVNGSQHGLLAVLMATMRAGDTLITEQLTYPGLISVSRLLGIKLMGVEVDKEGLLPASLDELCRAHRINALYCTPTIQNPTTALMSLARREVIAQLCREHNLLIIEDETHAVLMRERPLPISYFAPERGVVIGSLSKAVAAGLRAGYVHMPAAMVSRMTAAIRNSCWMATPLSLEIANVWIDDGTTFRLLDEQTKEIERRKTLVMGQLEGMTYRTHQFSPHFWIDVPAPWRASEIDRNLRQRNQVVATAEAFSVSRGTFPECIRISVSNASSGDGILREGFAALADVMRNGAEPLMGMVL
ncbi:GntR family transcriptional regulator [Burkholderia sp. Leaf177]|uniref:aminotransferase-like domain-containing protein n=1 Tax=Burkholderia sp. Leaf177 TaxID=1736287 RepID=UPI0006F8666F|nr:PLP-dependent aminotransferase family protein [Burkholderia sp. Leaf177]KQR82407.1 GntR family transcriptional regulator [Burkholderia sp. Leaf177]